MLRLAPDGLPALVIFEAGGWRLLRVVQVARILSFTSGGKGEVHMIIEYNEWQSSSVHVSLHVEEHGKLSREALSVVGARGLKCAQYIMQNKEGLPFAPSFAIRT